MTDKSRLLARLATIVADEATRRPLTVRLCEACLTMLGGDGASITVEASRTDRVTLCATDDAAAALEDLQEVLGEGPGKDAYRSGVAVQAPFGGTRTSAGRASPGRRASGSARGSSTPCRCARARRCWAC